MNVKVLTSGFAFVVGTALVGSYLGFHPRELFILTGQCTVLTLLLSWRAA